MILCVLRRATIALGCVLFVPAIAHANGDGNFCIGPNYLAYDLVESVGSAEVHRVYVVRVGAGRIAAPRAAEIPRIVVHGMRCRDDAVDVALFDAVHTVQITAANAPLTVVVTPLAVRGELPEWTRARTRNLAATSVAARTFETERHVVGTDADGTTYVLEITATPDSVRHCDPRVSARVAQLSRAGGEIASRVIVSGTRGPPCVRYSVAPFDSAAPPPRNPADILLDAVVFGPGERVNVRHYTGAVRAELTRYLERAAAYRTPRPPVGGGEARMIDAAMVGYEQRIFAAAVDTAEATRIAVAYVDSLRPCYEWEGFGECPEREALFADSYLRAHTTGPLRLYLPLLSAHRWLCAAEGYARENQTVQATRSREAYDERLAQARGVQSALFRAAAERLAQRARCTDPAR